LLPVLSRADLKPDDLITLSDLPKAKDKTELETTSKTKWILVDHNALQGELGKLYADRVVGCIDHHDEENKVPQDCGDEPRVVRKSGSCASLVVEYCRGTWEAWVAQSKDENLWNAQLARLALAPVLIDTTNLTMESKTTTTDREAVELLEKWIAAEEDAYSRDDYFNEISEAKQDIGSLSLPDILRKDYKQWNSIGMNLGISSVVKPISFLISKAGSNSAFLSTLKNFAEERDLAFCSIMTTFETDDVFQRELLVWALNIEGVKAITKFEKDCKEKLGLEAWKGGSLDEASGESVRRCWSQKKVDNSRKQVAPLLRAAIET
jgi:exopolyphosphatase